MVTGQAIHFVGNITMWESPREIKLHKVTRLVYFILMPWAILTKCDPKMQPFSCLGQVQRQTSLATSWDISEYCLKSNPSLLVAIKSSLLTLHFPFGTGRYILQVAGWNLITTGKPLALKIINNLYTLQGFLHKVVRFFHIVKTRSIRYKYLSIDTLRPVKSLQSHLDGRSTDVSIDSRFGSGLPSTIEDCHHKWSK